MAIPRVLGIPFLDANQDLSFGNKFYVDSGSGTDNNLGTVGVGTIRNQLNYRLAWHF